MDRRHFLTALISGAVLDPERLLWKPGKLISIPKPRVRPFLEVGEIIELSAFPFERWVVTREAISENNPFQARFERLSPQFSFTQPRYRRLNLYNHFALMRENAFYRHSYGVIESPR